MTGSRRGRQRLDPVTRMIRSFRGARERLAVDRGVGDPIMKLEAVSFPGTRLNRYSSKRRGTRDTRAKRRLSEANWDPRATDNDSLVELGVLVTVIVGVAVSGERAWDAGDKGPKSRHRVGTCTYIGTAFLPRSNLNTGRRWVDVGS